MATYHAFPCGKMNQSFRMENESNEILYEANMVAFKLLGAVDYIFINHVTAAKSIHKVSKTKTFEQSTMGFTVSGYSYFNLDGINCHDILKEKDCIIKLIAKLDIIHPEYALIDSKGNRVAVYKMNVTGEREAEVRGIGGKQNNTLITTDCTDLDLVFFGAFVLERVDFSMSMF